MCHNIYGKQIWKYLNSSENSLSGIRDFLVNLAALDNNIHGVNFHLGKFKFKKKKKKLQGYKNCTALYGNGLQRNCNKSI